MTISDKIFTLLVTVSWRMIHNFIVDVQSVGSHETSYLDCYNFHFPLFSNLTLGWFNSAAHHNIYHNISISKPYPFFLKIIKS